ncbi:hypothetical protein [Sphingomonas sp.]|uniref:hypothetical protein n=1 Tax=Sphingomonas sp. TaxID=28214 RepID=UPI002EDBB77B
MVTAEQKTNKYGSRYVYYHCSRQSLGPKCVEPAIQQGALEQQFVSFLSSLVIDPCIETWALETLASEDASNRETLAAQQRSVAAAIDENLAQQRELTVLRLRRMLSDTEFVLEKKRLETEGTTLRKALAPAALADRFELLREVISFSRCAVDWFLRGDKAAQLLIVKTVGSNFFLKGKKLSIQALKPFSVDPSFALIQRRCTVVEDVRTFRTSASPRVDRLVKDISESLNDPDTLAMLSNMKTLRDRFEPQPLPLGAAAA